MKPVKAWISCSGDCTNAAFGSNRRRSAGVESSRSAVPTMKSDQMMFVCLNVTATADPYESKVVLWVSRFVFDD